MIRRIVSTTLFFLLLLSVRGASYPYEWLSLGISEQMSTKQRVSWRTNPDMVQAKAQIALSTPFVGIEQRARTVDVSSGIEEDYGVCKAYHVATFDSLKPDTKYLYRVGNGAKAWSEWFEFKTADDKPQPFSFIYMADVQEGIDTHYPRVIRQAQRKAPNAAFILFTGDLTGRATEAEFDSFFRANGWVFGTTPVAVIPDNHEYATNNEGVREKLTSLWSHIFNYPEDTPKNIAAQGNYTFDYQGCRFILINTKELVDGTPQYTRQMLLWIQQTLENNPNDWCIVAQHQPIYSVADGRSSGEIATLLKPLYEKYGVDLVLSGHDHVYSKTTTKIAGKPATPVYMSSNAGSQVYVPAYHLYVDRIGSDMQLFQIIDVSSQHLIYEAFDATGELYDAFRIERTEKGKKYIDNTPAVAQSTLLPPSRKQKYDDKKWFEHEEKRQIYIESKK